MLTLPELPDTSMTQRIIIALQTAIAEGRFKPGDKLPARRVMANHLGLDTRTVGDAYSRLEAQGIVTSRVGSGTYINKNALSKLQAGPVDASYGSITIVSGATDLIQCSRDTVRVLVDVIQGIHDVLGNVKINLVESFNQQCLGGLTSADAVLIFRAHQVDPAMLQQLAKRDIPILGIWSGGWEGTLEGLVPQVDYDRQEAGRLACQHLIDCGYKRIGFIGSMGTPLSIKFFAFTNTLFNARLDYQIKHVREVSSYSPGSAYRAASQMIQTGDMPDALFVDTDCKALEVLNALKDAGLHVPNQVGVIGYDDIPEATKWSDVPLTTIRTPRPAIGRCVGEMLQSWKQQGLPLQSRILPPELIVRKSTRGMVRDHEAELAITACGPQGRRAFTLIELLVVISIVSLLVAILLPALSNARLASQRTVSLSNIRQISVSVNTYTIDNDSSMPFLRGATWTGTVWDDTHVYWPQLIYEGGYLASIHTFWSPQRENQSHLATYRPYRGAGYGMSVGVSGEEKRYNNGDANHEPMRLGRGNAPPPSNMVLLAESWHRLLGNNGYFIAQPRWFSDNDVFRLFNYQGAVVRSYVDGRANALGTVTSGTAGGQFNLISGRTVDVNNGDAPPHQDDLGWRYTWPPDTAVAPSLAHNGDWSFRRDDDYQLHAPWYTDWRTRSWLNRLR